MTQSRLTQLFRRSRGTVGFTLVEVLAVVVLLGMAMAAVASGLSGASEGSRMRASSAAALDLDRRGRLAAMSGARVVLFSEPGHLRLVQETTGEQLAERTLPADVNVSYVGSDGRTAFQNVVFSRTGQSPDYQIVVTVGNSHYVCEVTGRTGWCDERRGR